NLSPVLKAAREFKGAAFVEIFQNCIVYNKARFEDFVAKKTAAETQIHVEHGKPMLFANGTKGLKLNLHTLKLEVVDVGENATHVEDVFVHDETSPAIAQMLVTLPREGYPMPLGVIYRAPATSFDDAFWAHHPTKGKRTAKVADALRKGSVWQKN
ncbi:MAG: hypothetical protein KAH44_29770, partial [Oricola sp.]|nr:hypothetical protein [Oricola sp.]